MKLRAFNEKYEGLVFTTSSTVCLFHQRSARNSTNYVKQKATLAQRPEDVLNKMDLVNKG